MEQNTVHNCNPLRKLIAKTKSTECQHLLRKFKWIKRFTDHSTDMLAEKSGLYSNAHNIFQSVFDDYHGILRTSILILTVILSDWLLVIWNQKLAVIFDSRLINGAIGKGIRTFKRGHSCILPRKFSSGNALHLRCLTKEHPRRQGDRELKINPNGE